MKNLFLSLALLAGSVSAMAQAVPGVLNPNHPGLNGTQTGGTYKFLPESSAISTEVLDLSSSLFKTHTVEAVLGTGTNSACTFQVEGSSTTANWYSISGGTPIACTAGSMTSFADKPVRYIRIHILTYTGTAPVTFYYTGVK
jgi:hypothetical protein